MFTPAGIQLPDENMDVSGLVAIGAFAVMFTFFLEYSFYLLFFLILVVKKNFIFSRNNVWDTWTHLTFNLLLHVLQP